jgi:hypothetical protein
MGVIDELRDRLSRWFGEFNAQFLSGKLIPDTPATA